jgi:hypothetical protein
MDRALEKVKSVLENLSGGKELDGYRTWWYYIAGNTAHLAKRTIAVDEKLDKSYYSSALRPSGDGDPDSVWILRNQVLGFEAKTEENEKDLVYIDACRQTRVAIPWQSPES